MQKYVAVWVIAVLIMLAFHTVLSAAQSVDKKDLPPAQREKALPSEAKVAPSDLKNRSHLPEGSVLRKAKVEPGAFLSEKARKEHIMSLYGKKPKFHRSVQRKASESPAFPKMPETTAIAVRKSKTSAFAMIIGGAITVILLILIIWRSRASAGESGKPIRISIPVKGLHDRRPEGRVVDKKVQEDWVKDYISQAEESQGREAAKLEKKRRLRGKKRDKG